MSTLQDTFFDSGRKYVAMVTAYYGKNGGKILRRKLLPQFFTNSHEIWHRCLPWGVDVQDTFFDSGRKCVAMVTAYYGKIGGKSCIANYFLSLSSIRVKFGTTCVPTGVHVHLTHALHSGTQYLIMVTACYTIGKYCGAGVLITFSDISSFILFTDKYCIKHEGWTGMGVGENTGRLVTGQHGFSPVASVRFCLWWGRLIKT